MKIGNKRWVKAWFTVLGLALVVALVLTFLPYEASIDTGGILGISLRQASANPGIGEFSYKKKLTFNTTAISVTTNQTNFPVCVHINTSSWATESERTAFFAAWNVGGKRCQFFDSDGTTNLDYEVELYNSATPEAIYWVEVPQVDGNSSTDYIWVAFGNDPNGADQDNPEGVWDSNFKAVFHMKGTNMITESGNPVKAAGIETSLIMDGSGGCDMWYRTGDDSLGEAIVNYAHSTDSKCAVWTDDLGNPVDGLNANSAYPSVIKVGSTYYMFCLNHYTGDGNVYLYSSTNKTTWTIMNSGNPVLTHGANSSYWYYWLFNVSVAVVGETWHMVIEGTNDSGASFNTGYSYSNLTDLNWNTHISSSAVITNSACPSLIYVPNKNAFLAFHSTSVSTKWQLQAHYASLSDNLSLAASWHSAPGFVYGVSGIHITDNVLCVTDFTKDYNLVFNYNYNQTSLYQMYSDLSLDDFYDVITASTATVKDSTSNANHGTPKSLLEPSGTSGQVSKGQVFDGSNDYDKVAHSASLAITSQITIETWWKPTTSMGASYWLDKGIATGAYFFLRYLITPTQDFGLFISSAWREADGGTNISGYTGWHYSAGTYTGANMYLYLDGVQDGTKVQTGSITANTEAITIGADWSSTPTGVWPGSLDEIRISDTGRAADWIKLTYYSMKKTNFNGDSWLSWGVQETAVPTITNSPDSNGFGVLAASATANTAINYFTITNTGGCAVDVTIQGTDLAGGDDTWDLADDATPGENIYGLYAGKDDADDLFDVIVRETATYNTLVSALAESATQGWGLKIYMPTSLSGYDSNQMSGNITLVASEAA